MNMELISKKKGLTLKTCIYALVLLVVMLITAIIQFEFNFSFLQIVTFSINGLVIWIMLIQGLARHTFSIDLVHSLFCLLFFWVAPIIQISTGFKAWGADIKGDDTIRANVFILIWLVCYNVGKLFVQERSWEVKKLDYTKISKTTIFTLWWVTIAFTLIILIKNGFRIENISFSDSNEQSLNLLLGHSSTAFITFSTIITISWFKENKYPKIFTLISVLCLLLTCFPTSLSRYAAGSIYICLLVNLFPFFKKKYRLTILIVVGIVFAFPIMDLYRFKGITEVSFSEIINQVLSVKTYFSSGNYDAYQMLTTTGKFVDEYGVTYGGQLLGAILFFVPRQIWQSKPIGSGAYIADKLNLAFENISCPIVGEAYINFGIAGIIVFAFIFGYIVRKLDNTYWFNNRKEFSYINLFYFYLLPYIFFLCRGDMLSTWAYLFANIVILFILYKIIRKTNAQ